MNTTEAKHSALPWVVDKFMLNQIRQPLVSKRRRIICPPDADGTNDAAYIVQAVNLLDTFIVTCENACNEIKGGQYEQALHTLQNVLNKASVKTLPEMQ